MPMRAGLPIVALVLAAAASGGCVAAGLAAGPLMSAVQVISDRAVERTVSADVRATAVAVEAVLLRSGVRVGERTADGDGLQLRGTGEKVDVHAKLTRVTARMTKLSLRIEDGGFVADRETAEHLHDQVARALRDATTTVTASSEDRTSLAALAALEVEVKRLRATIDAERSSRRAPVVQPREAASGAPAPRFSIDRSGVVTIPASYALPTIAKPAPLAGSVAATGPATVSTVATPQSGTGPSGPVPIEALAPASVTAPALRPVGVLTPASPITGARRAD